MGQENQNELVERAGVDEVSKQLRPMSKQLWACHCEPDSMFHDLKQHKPATPADLLAAVRRAVEDGTIEAVEVDTSRAGVDLAGFPAGGTYLVIPLSDGGSET
jgi:hypothetical protein